MSKELFIKLDEEYPKLKIKATYEENTLYKLIRKRNCKWNLVRDYNPSNNFEYNIENEAFYNFSVHVKKDINQENIDAYKEFFYLKILHVGEMDIDLEGNNKVQYFINKRKSDYCLEDLMNMEYKKVEENYYQLKESLIFINLADYVNKVSSMLDRKEKLAIFISKIDIVIKNLSMIYNTDNIIFFSNKINEFNKDIYDSIKKYLLNNYPGIKIIYVKGNLKASELVDYYKNRKVFDGERIYCGIKNIRYVFLPAKNINNKKLLVGFSGFAYENEALYNFTVQTNSIDANRLFILDDYGYPGVGVYYLGENRKLEVESSVISLILYYVNKLNITLKDVISFGRSKGGSAAFYFGMKYSFGAVIAGCFQYLIGDFLLRSKNADVPQVRVLEYISGGIKESDKIYANSLYYRTLLRNNNNTKLYLHIVKNDPYNKYTLKALDDLNEFNINYELDIVEGNSHASHELFKKYINYLEDVYKRLNS